MKTLTWLSAQDAPGNFPELDQALDEPAGLLAAGGDLSTARLLAAYRLSIFPWYSPGQPVLWWAPDPREVLFPAEFHASRSLAKTLRNSGYRSTIDQDFRAVIEACAAPRASSAGTWITLDMQSAYVDLHERGYAHSVETYCDERLIGGLYGVRLGRVFFGESMFSRKRDASKVALAYLVQACLLHDIVVIDCQLPSQHLESLGSRAISRAEFQSLVREHASDEPLPLQI